MARRDWPNMTGRERALRTLRFESTDRIPIMGGGLSHPDFLSWYTGLNFWEHKRQAALAAYRKLGADMLPHLVLPSSQEDFRAQPSHALELDGILVYSRDAERANFHSPEDVVTWVEALPDPDSLAAEFDLEAARDDYIQRIAQHQEELGDDALWVGGYGQPNFMMYIKFGYENYFGALALYPEKMERFFAYSGALAHLQNRAITAAVREGRLIPYVYGGQDICDNRGPMIRPQLLDRIYFPYLRHAIEPLLDAGVDIIWHSDGNITPIRDRLLACGIRGFQGFQEETGVDLAWFADYRTEDKRKLHIWGSMSVSRVLPHGTVEDVEREVERCIDTAAPGGGFFLGTSNTVQPEVPFENIITMYEHGIEYGRQWCASHYAKH